MTCNAYIGIDLGTSGCRVIAIDDNENIIAFKQKDFYHAHHYEQNPNSHWQLTLSVLTELIPLCYNYHIKSIAVDATSGSILVTDKSGLSLSPIMMYNNACAIEQSKQIASIAPTESGAHGVSGGLAKLLYLQQHTELATEHYLLHQADWINVKLGAPLGISDENNALKSGYDPIARCWPEWIHQLISTDVLPKVVPAGTPIGTLSPQLTALFKLTHPPEIKAGTTDSIASLIATGANNIGDAVTSLGSSLVVKVISDKPLFLPKQGVYSHRLADKWVVGGASNSGGAVLKHYFDPPSLQRLSSLIQLKDTPPDYYPLISKGERFPVNDPELKPRLTPRPESEVSFLYGLLSGIANIEQQAYKVLEQAGATPIKSLRTVGGGSVNQTWQAIRQQKIPVSFITPKHTEAAYGAALLAKG